jgi:hypothetical protein
VLADALGSDVLARIPEIANERAVLDRRVLRVLHLDIVAFDTAEILGEGLYRAKERIIVALDGDVLANATATTCLLREQDWEHGCDSIQMEFAVG